MTYLMGGDQQLEVVAGVEAQVGDLPSVAREHGRRQRGGVPSRSVRRVSHTQHCCCQHVLKIADHQVCKVPASA